MPLLECNRENMTRLAEALESGDYKQAAGYLRLDKKEGESGYCCVGVACDISGEGRWMKADGDHEQWQYVTYQGFSSATMPKPVVEWLGLKERQVDGVISYDLDALPLSPHTVTDWLDRSTTEFDHGTTLNDSGEDFSQIARRIRDTYLTDSEVAHETPTELAAENA